MELHADAEAEAEAAWLEPGWPAPTCILYPLLSALVLSSLISSLSRSPAILRVHRF
jgi:hypothetical protein